MKVAKIYEGTDPGATPGRVFTASIGQEKIVNEGAFLDSLDLGLKGAVSTAAVAIETFAGVLSEYSLRFGAETRLQMSFRQLLALSNFFYGNLPFIWENTDNTGNDFIGGVRVPVQQKVDPAKEFNHTATYATQTNIGTETLAISGRWDETDGGKKPIHAVAVGHTTAGSAGYETLGFRIVPVGKLIGLIIQSPNVFTDANIDVSVQRVKILADGALHSEFNALAHRGGWQGKSVGVLDPMDDLMNVFDIYDLRPSGIDAKAQQLTVQLDVQDVSDAITLIPVLEVA